MTASFRRKLVYMIIILVLFGAMVPVRDGIKKLRQNEDLRLSDATLGNVDPTSSTMVLVLGGLRGVAANILWTQALDMQERHDWRNLKPVVESIVKLQPHFLSIWTFQSWNLAYNVSVEWDQVEDKYFWIKEGIKFVREGTRVNKHSPELRWDTGWYYFHKIGKADEAELLRKLYRNDTKPEIGPQGQPQEPFNPALFNPDGDDNYQTAGDWFKQSMAKLDGPPKQKPKRMSEVAFRSYVAQSQTNYAIAREAEGQFGDVIRREWLSALRLWQEHADIQYDFTDGKWVKLEYPPEIMAAFFDATAIFERSEELVEKLSKDVEKLKPDEREAIKTEFDSIVQLTPKFLSGVTVPVLDELPPGARDHLTPIQPAFEKLQSCDLSQIAQPGAAGDEARKRLGEFAEAVAKFGRVTHEELYWWDRYSSTFNYRYWKERSLAESERETIAARKHFYDGKQKSREADLVEAQKEFEAGLAIWKGVLDRYPRLRDDDSTIIETVDLVMEYQKIRDQRDLPPLPDDQIPFGDIVKRVTEPQLTPEQMREMEAFMREQQKTGADMTKVQQQIMEKVKQMKEKASGQAKPAPSGESPKPGDGDAKSGESPKAP